MLKMGIDYAMHGMAVFSEEIEMKKQDTSEKMKKGWQGNSENCRDV